MSDDRLILMMHIRYERGKYKVRFETEDEPRLQDLLYLNYSLEELKQQVIEKINLMKSNKI